MWDADLFQIGVCCFNLLLGFCHAGLLDYRASDDVRQPYSAIRHAQQPSSPRDDGPATGRQQRYAGGSDVVRRGNRRPPTPSSSIASGAALHLAGSSAPLQYYARPVRHCLSNDDCDETEGESCLRVYDGCGRGRCMCNPRLVTPLAGWPLSRPPNGRAAQATDRRRSSTTSGSSDDFGSGLAASFADGFNCNTRVVLNETCASTTSSSSTASSCCDVAAQVNNGVPRGRPMTSEVGVTPCLLANHRLVGQPCSPSSHVCLQRSGHGFTANDVICAGGECQCTDGYRTAGQLCQRTSCLPGNRVSCMPQWWCCGDHGTEKKKLCLNNTGQVNERGCLKSYHCEGGAICVHHQCVCPDGYDVPSGYVKCIRRAAITGIQKDGLCDEINERKYCASGLVCHRCDRETVYKCVRFLLYNELSVVSSARRAFITSHTIIAPLIYALTSSSLLR